MSVVIAVTLLLLVASGALTLARFLRGPDTLDRIAALDVLIVLVVAAAGVYVAYYQDGTFVPLLAAVALVGFVGSATASRLVARRRRHR